MPPAMRASRAWFFASLLLAGCANEPAVPQLVPLPPQRELVQAPDLPYEPFFVLMSEPRARALIVRDIGPAGLQSWTAANPAMQFTLSEPGQWLAAVRFNATGATLRDTGPIALTFSVNGRPVGSMRVTDDSMRTFSMPVRLDTTRAELSFSVDKPWVAPADGAKLGVLLHGMGFKRLVRRER